MGSGMINHAKVDPDPRYYPFLCVTIKEAQKHRFS
jgi:hypothetical protein